MIRLTLMDDGAPIWVNPTYIVDLLHSASGSEVDVVKGAKTKTYYVEQSPEQIMVLLALARFGAPEGMMAAIAELKGGPTDG